MQDKGRKQRYKVNVQVRNATDADGNVLTIADLPPADLLCKAALAEVVCHGLMTLDEVCNRYDLTFEEFLDCYRSLQRLGGLRSDQSISVGLSRGDGLGPPYSVTLQ